MWERVHTVIHAHVHTEQLTHPLTRGRHHSTPHKDNTTAPGSLQSPQGHQRSEDFLVGGSDTMMGLPRTSFLSLDSVQARGVLTHTGPWTFTWTLSPQRGGGGALGVGPEPRVYSGPLQLPRARWDSEPARPPRSRKGAGSRAHSLPAAEALCSRQGSPRCPGSSGAKAASEWHRHWGTLCPVGALGETLRTLLLGAPGGPHPALPWGSRSPTCVLNSS